MYDFLLFLLKNLYTITKLLWNNGHFCLFQAILVLIFFIWILFS